MFVNLNLKSTLRKLKNRDLRKYTIPKLKIKTNKTENFESKMEF